MLKLFSVPARYVFCALSMLALITAFMLRTSLNIAITQMVSDTPESSSEDKSFNWSEEKQGVILSSFYWGYILTHIPGGLLAEKFGGKHVLGSGILFTAVLTALTPFVVRQNPTLLIIFRFMEGLGQGVMLPSIYTLIARWLPPAKTSFLTSTIFLGIQIGIFLGNFISGIILQFTNDWSIVFYVIGSIGIIWWCAWCLLVYNDPESHPFLAEKERLYIQKSIGSTSRNKDLPSTPWKSVLTSKAVWTLLAANLGQDWAIYTILSDLPKYMHDVHKIDSMQNGFMSGLPFLAILVWSWTSSALSDFLINKNILSLIFVRKLYITICSLGPAVGVVCASYAETKSMVYLFLFLGMGLMAFSLSSLKIIALDLSPNYSGSIMAVVNGTSVLGGIATPYLIGVLTPHRSAEEWRVVFWIMAAVLVSTNVIFILFGSCRVQPWNEYHEEPLPEKMKEVSTS